MIVSNTTPLSNFLHLERMDILQQFFKEIHIPFLPVVQPLMDTLREQYSFWISEKMYQHVLCLADEIAS